MTPKELLFKANEAMNAKDFILASQLFTQILNKFPNHELSPSVKFEIDYLGKSIEEIPALKHITS